MIEPRLMPCPHLYVVGDAVCRLCLAPLDGLVYWSTPSATVGLVTKEGVVVDAPPYARKWALGRRVAELPEAEEIRYVTDTNDDGVDWGDMTPPEQAQYLPDSVATWTPEDGQQDPAPKAAQLLGPLPEAPISINFKVTGEPMITVRGYTGMDITAVLNDLTAHGVWANIAAAQADLRTHGQLGAGLGPMSPPGAPAPAQAPSQVGYAPGPATPPPFGPNVSVPSAPGYMPPQQSYQSGPPQQGWNGGGGGGYNQQDSKPEPAMQPPGWMRVNARSGPGFDNWKQIREQQKDYLKGKIKWGGKSDYWIEPSIAQWLAGLGFAVTP